MPNIKPVGGVTQAIAASALRAQQARMRIIAENLANADSTSKVPGGDPYRRQAPVFEETRVQGANGVRMSRVEADPTQFRERYDGEGMLHRFRAELVAPYATALRRFTPLTVPPGWLGEEGRRRVVQ